MLKAELITQLSLSTSQFHSVVKELGLDVKDVYTEEETAKILAGKASKPKATRKPRNNAKASEATTSSALSAIANLQASGLTDSRVAAVHLAVAQADAEDAAYFTAYMKRKQQNQEKIDAFRQGHITSQIQVVSHLTAFDPESIIDGIESGFELPELPELPSGIDHLLLPSEAFGYAR